MEERKCLYCGEPLIGRVDKKFCCDSCRNSYNYEKTHKQVNVIRKINGILARNHNILTELNPNGKGFATRQQLNEKGFDCGKADGIFGDKTLKAVKDFQQYSGLVIDGIVGPKTWGALYLQTAEDDKRYTVVISGINKEQASALLRMYPEADVKEGG